MVAERIAITSIFVTATNVCVVTIELYRLKTLVATVVTTAEHRRIVDVQVAEPAPVTTVTTTPSTTVMEVIPPVMVT